MKRIHVNVLALTATAILLNACHMKSASTEVPGRPGSIGIIGDTADVTTPVKGGVALIGGGGNVDGAFQWMMDRSGGGDVVVLTASGNGSYTTTSILSAK